MSDETRDDETRDDNELTRNNDGDMPGDSEAMAAGSEDQPAGEGSDGQTDDDADDQPRSIPTTSRRTASMPPPYIT